MKQLTLGQKIKELRLKKGMTQAELAGETVTRNMMSQIEHGNALPSVHTILEISERLEVPTEYFFSEMDEPSAFYKIYAIGKIRKLYHANEYNRCIRQIERLDVWDDETEYLYAKCCFEKGQENYRNGHLETATEFFEKANQHGAKSVYLKEDFFFAVNEYLKIMQMIRKKENGTIREENLKIKKFLGEVTYPIFYQTEEKKPWFYDLESPYVQHLAIYEEIKKGISNETAENLKISLRNLLETLDENEYFILKYYILCDLETLAKQTDDYKLAYECSVAKLACSEKMNT